VWSTALTGVRTQPSLFFICGTGGFDSHGRYETACSSPYQAALVLLDPTTLEVLASQALPTAGEGGSASGLSTGYLYIDDEDRAVIPTAGGTLTIAAAARTLRHALSTTCRRRWAGSRRCSPRCRTSGDGSG
jgi:hypothetical protein